jgi:hypothetical protein
LRYRVRLHSVRIGLGGTKLARNSPAFKLAEPLGVEHVGLATGGALLDVPCVD